MSKKIAILDYGVGNLLSIQRAIDQFNIQSVIVPSLKESIDYDAMILPGVGAFKDGMHALLQQELVDAIKTYASWKRPILGICLGMQLLFESSEEFGYSLGLGLLQGKVVKLPTLTVEQQLQKIPHVGWSNVMQNMNPLFSGIHAEAEYYFCHSYAVHSTQLKNNVTYYSYGGHKIMAAVTMNNIYGVQFHPEKSGKAGLQLIQNFLRMTNCI